MIYLNVEDGDFIHSQKLHELATDMERGIIIMYFAFTSLSTVGFGDFHPYNNFERLVCAFILLFGNAIFGYIIGNFTEMMY